MVGIDSEDEFGPGMTPEEKAETVEEVDANDIDWQDVAHKAQMQASELAEKLHDQKTYPYEEGDFLILGPEIFTKIDDQSAIMYKGVAYIIKQGEDLQPKELKAYSVGEFVEVQKFANWVPGRITSKQAGILNVDTEYGPVGVGSYHLIRKVAK